MDEFSLVEILAIIGGICLTIIGTLIVFYLAEIRDILHEHYELDKTDTEKYWNAIERGM